MPFRQLRLNNPGSNHLFFSISTYFPPDLQESIGGTINGSTVKQLPHLTSEMPKYYSLFEIFNFVF